MSYLFISRKNVHARYYNDICPKLSVETEIHIMGKPVLGAFQYFRQAFNTNLSEVVSKQIQRKQSRPSMLWSSPLIIQIYRVLLTFFEKLRLAKYLYILSAKPRKAIVMWNGKKLPNQTIAIAAELLGIRTYFFENGLLPGTTSLDPKGVNFSATMPKTEAQLQSLKLTDEKFLPPVIKQREAHQQRTESEKVKLPKRYLFVPFQVPHDTQIVQYSPWIKSMESLYHEVVKAFDELNDNDLYLVFKEHPSWHKHYNHLYNLNEKVIFANDNNTVELIEGAEAVITINSTVGLEALLLNKTVLTLGQACFNIDGLVLHAPTNKILVEQFKAIESWRLNADLKDNFFRYLQQIYTIPGSWKEPNSEHIMAINNRLTQKDQFSQLDF